MPATLLATIHPALGFAEPVASLSHFFGAAVAVVAGASLLRRAGDDPLRRRVLSLFTLAVVLQLTASGFYHQLPVGTPARHLARRFDLGMIPLLIGGCFLPLWLFLLRGRRFANALLALVAVGAVVGSAAQIVFLDVIPGWIAVLFYVIFSSIGTPIAVWLVVTRGLRETLPFFLCGVAFSLAAIVQLPRELVIVPGVIEYHEVVHLLILVGLFLDWVFVARLTDAAVMGTARVAEAPRVRPAASDAVPTAASARAAPAVS